MRHEPNGSRTVSFCIGIAMVLGMSGIVSFVSRVSPPGIASIVNGIETHKNALE